MTHDEDGKTPIEGRLFNAPRKSVDEFMVYDIEDRFHSCCFCTSEAEVRQVLDNFRHPSRMRVRRVTLDHLSRNVTSDFLSEEPVSIYAGNDPDHAYEQRRA